MSTFIVETDRATFANVGFNRLGEQRSKAICEEVFAEELGRVRRGHPFGLSR
jgi:hypothetical protein